MEEKMMQQVIDESREVVKMFDEGMLAVDEAYNKIAWAVLQVMQTQGIEVK